MARKQLLLEAVQRGKYAPLFHYLSDRPDTEWEATFSDIERILGFQLPKSARIYRPWWANDSGSGHSQSMAWTLAGWKTKEVNMESETLSFHKIATNEPVHRATARETPYRSSPPKMDDFRKALREVLAEARSRGDTTIVVRAGELHRLVGGYPTPFNRMPMCCKAMYEEQTVGDQTIEKPRKDYGASLTIAYRLPR